MGGWASSTAADVCLLGRSGRTSGTTPSLLFSGEGHAASVTMARCDVASEEESAFYLSRASSGSSLKAVIHAGGVLQDSLIMSQSASGVRSVFAPKVEGARRLCAGVYAQGLQAFALFSSVASFIGSAGQANYAAANSVLDSIASSRQSTGCAGIPLGNIVPMELFVK